MKVKFIMIAAILTVALTSCKKENETKQPGQENVEAATKQNFSVELDVVAEKDDNFALYFTEDGTIAFSLDNVAWSEVKAGSGSQKVVFNLSEEVVPTHIRLDFSLKKPEERGDITLQKVKIDFYGKSFEFKGSDFFKYFIEKAETKTEVNPADGTIKFVKDPTAKTTPFYYPTQNLIDEIAKITK